MINRPNRSKLTPRFTAIECQALKTAIGFVTAGEWDETLSQAEYDALTTAWDKITQHDRTAREAATKAGT